MGKRTKLKVRLFLIRDGKTEQIERLPDDVLQLMGQRLSRTLSDYYTQHPDEYRVLCRSDE